jgi:hypothetical protein
MCFVSEKERKQLNTNGYIFIENVLSKGECDNYIDEIWGFLQNGCKSINRNEPKTLCTRNWPKNNNGHINIDVGHTQFIWDIRTNNNIIDIFNEIYDDNELKTSFEGITIVKPPEYVKRRKQPKEFFYLCHPLNKNDINCYRGLLVLEDCDINDCTFNVLVGSHNVYDDYTTEHSINKYKNFIRIDDSTWFINNLCEKKTHKIKRGTLILYDSKLAYYIKSPQRYRTNKNRFFYSVNLSYRPTRDFTDPQLLKRKNHFENGTMTTFLGYNKLQPMSYNYRSIFRFKYSCPTINIDKRYLI